MEIVGNSITETDVAMELCKEVQVEEYVIHVEESTNFYTHLRFSLLASTWFPRPLGACLWSALHMLLVLFEALMLLVLFSAGFVLALSWDALMVYIFIDIVLLILCVVICVVIYVFLGRFLIAVLAWLWLVITCQCCTMPTQDVGRYILTAGGTLRQDPQSAPAAEPPTILQDIFMCVMNPMILRFVRHVILVSFPHRRAQLGNLCGEIVPWYDTIVI